MRRIGCITIAFILCLSLLATTASAFGGVQTERIDYEDGSYAIITTVAGSMTRATTNDSKTYTYYNRLGQKCFSYTLYATFTYDGSSSSADSCYCGADVYLSGWTGVSHNEYTAGSTAYGEAVFSGPNGEERPVSLSLTCDRNGNVK